MGKVEENIKKILIDLKNSRFQNEIPKKELILIISKYTQSPYGYINRLWADNYIKIDSIEGLIFKIITLEFKSETMDTNVIKEGYEEG